MNCGAKGRVVVQQYGIFREFRLLSFGPLESDYSILEDVVKRRFCEIMEDFSVEWSVLLFCSVGFDKYFVFILNPD